MGDKNESEETAGAKPATPPPATRGAKKKPARKAAAAAETDALSSLFATRQPIDLDAQGFGKKRFKYRGARDHEGKHGGHGAGEVMRLKVEPNDPRGRTHKAKSQNMFWEGDEEEFRKHFDVTDEKDAEPVPPLDPAKAAAE